LRSDRKLSSNIPTTIFADVPALLQIRAQLFSDGGRGQLTYTNMVYDMAAKNLDFVGSRRLGSGGGKGQNVSLCRGAPAAARGTLKKNSRFSVPAPISVSAASELKMRKEGQP
jgi:hypothetical protein